MTPWQGPISKKSRPASGNFSDAPITMRTVKEGLRRLRIEGAEADDHDLVVAAYMSEDFREGMEAFLGKRKPNWKGR